MIAWLRVAIGVAAVTLVTGGVLWTGLRQAAAPQREAAVTSEAIYAQDPDKAPASAALWAVDPRTPDDNLPPVGRSLFDFLMTGPRDGSIAYVVPFPFQALLDRLGNNCVATGAHDAAGEARSAHRVAKRLLPLPSTRCSKAVLIPLGRSLQRNAAAPHYFEYPRIVVAFDADAGGGILLKDRVYLGYQEKANVVEVLSYNEAAGRFEFQVVKDYRAGGTAQVFYANRVVCTACHQNHAPIFSRAAWDETNANPRVSARLSQVADRFHGVDVDRGIDLPSDIDEAVRRATLFSAYQRLWRDACEVEGNASASVRCRAALFKAVLQSRLSGGRAFDEGAASYREQFLPVAMRQWSARWPAGLAIADAEIPNRDPLARVHAQTGRSETLVAQADIASRFDPLAPRAPSSIWTVSDPALFAQPVRGLGEFIADADVKALDDHLYLGARNVTIPRRMYSAACEFRQYAARTRTIEFACTSTDAALRMGGRLVAERGAFATGAVEKLRVAGGSDVGNFEAAVTVASVNPGWVGVTLTPLKGKLHPRLATGDAIGAIALRWRKTGAIQRKSTDNAVTYTGQADIEVRDDFAQVVAAIDKVASETDRGTVDAFAAKPFRRAEVLGELFAKLGASTRPWCCIDGAAMPPARVDDRFDSEDELGGARDVDDKLKRFYQYCGSCHLSKDKTPPNFLLGNAAEVKAAVMQCSERLYFRLGMWQLPPGDRPKTTMPPELALHALNSDPQRWARSGDLAELRDYVAEIIRGQTGAAPSVESFMARSYEGLRPCLTNG